jgi:hypothetical protein
MKTNLNRRDFIVMGACAGLSCCIFMAGKKLYGISLPENEVPDLEKLTYCGYKCADDCQFLKATRENNTEQKQEVYKLWQIEERFGVQFNPEEIICWGCKAKDKPEGVVITNCTVRSCAISKGLECCIQCTELNDCKKDLWERFPEFKKTVIEMQKQYNNKAVI